MTVPVIFMWDGDGMAPLARFKRLCDEQYVIGETYTLAEQQDRSDATHKHEFAWLKEAWLNLPEAVADQYPTVEHLRKRALIDAGYYHEAILDAGTNASALRAASFIRAREEFTLVIVRGPYVVTRTAKSQSRRAMDKVEFQASKTALLNTVSEMIGVPAETLTREADRAA